MRGRIMAWRCHDLCVYVRVCRALCVSGWSVLYADVHDICVSRKTTIFMGMENIDFPGNAKRERFISRSQPSLIIAEKRVKSLWGHVLSIKSPFIDQAWAKPCGEKNP